jgi:hypothetical protein
MVADLPDRREAVVQARLAPTSTVQGWERLPVILP